VRYGLLGTTPMLNLIKIANKFPGTSSAALESFSKSPSFQAWDPAVLKIHLECGLYDTTDEHGDPIAKLKTPGIQEAVACSGVHTGYEAYVRLAALDKRIALRWIMPGKSTAIEIGVPGGTPLKVWVRPENATNTKIYEGGHMVSGLGLDENFLN